MKMKQVMQIPLTNIDKTEVSY